MIVVAALTFILANVQFSHSCDGEGQILICRKIPSYFSPGYLTLVMYLSDTGEINSTVFHSNNLTTITRLRIDSAGVTRIAAGAFSSFQNLTSLSLMKNAVTEMNSNWFGRPAVLSELSLTENQIEIVKLSTLNGLINLTKLSLNKNRIRIIDPNSFSSQTNLGELDLSENRMTRISPEVFSSLRFTKIRLDGNPWDCSCESVDSVNSLKDLWRRSLLERQMEVTCESPPPLSGQPVWNVSVCAGPPSGTQTVHSKPADTLTTVPASSAKVMTTLLLRSTSKTETSLRPKPTDAPSVLSSHTAPSPARPTSETKTSVQPKPTDIITTVTLKMATYVTSSPSVTETFIHPKPTDMPITVSPHTAVTEPPSNTNTVRTLTVVIVVLCVLLFVVCFLAVLHKRKRNNKTVIPGRPKEEKNNLEEDIRSRNQSPGHSEKKDPDMAWKRPFTGIRAKSANAILLMSSFRVSGKDQVTLQNETEVHSKETENQAERKQKRVNEMEADGGISTEHFSNTDIIQKNEKQDADRDLGDNPHCVSVNTETVPYLSIGTNPDDPNKDSTDTRGQRSLVGKVMGRISTWPPTAIQWHARCKMKEEDEDRPEVFTVWTQNETFQVSGEVKKTVNKVEHPSGSDGVQKEDRIEKNQDLQTASTIDSSIMNEAHTILRHPESSKPNDKTTSFSEAHSHTNMRLEEQQKEEEVIQDPATGRQRIETPNLDQERLSQNPDLKPAHKTTGKSGNKAEPRNEQKGAVTSRQRENRSTGSKAPSGGASPDDETLLSGNEYAFMDLLHEVVQNNGRWTRERWKQIHINKQRR